MPTPRRTAAAIDEAAPTRAPARRGGGSPGIVIILGIVILLFWGFVATLQVQTNEAFINGRTNVQNILQPQWSIWLQLPKLFFGDAVPGPPIGTDEAIGVIIGWGIEIFFFALVVAYEVAIHTSAKFGRFLGTAIRVVLFIICAFDFWSDANYGNVSPFAHLAFAVFCSVVVGFGLTWGIALLEHGWKRA